jgi:hypothetical protein
MASHVKLLGILHIVFGAIGLVIGLGVLLLFGGLAGLAGAHSDNFLAVPILGVIGVFVFGLMLVLSLPGLIAGFGLISMRPWARVLGIVLSAIELLHFPFGTLLGIYGLWVLLNAETERLFR